MNKQSIKGKMIFFDGPDGSGKSTQLKEVAKYLRNKGYDVLETRQPGMPGEHGDNIRKAILGDDRYRNFWATRMLFASEHLEFMERYGYEANKVVLCDRSVITSNTCIGGAEYGDIHEVISVLSPIYRLSDRKPDTIIVFSVTPETVKQRLQSRLSAGGEINHYDKKEESFHTLSCENYNLMEELDEGNPRLLGLSSAKKTIHTIDSNGTVDDIKKSVINLLEEIYDI